jgi:hypothetical protein
MYRANVEEALIELQWNPGNTTNHGTDVGWSCYCQWSWKSGGEFPAKTIAYRSIACLHAINQSINQFILYNKRPKGLALSWQEADREETGF